jgi:hypothetical protein
MYSTPALLRAVALAVGVATLLAPHCAAQDELRGAGLPAAVDLRVPVHGRANDPGYGIWTAGANFKASFHDGFAFYPRGGDDGAVLRLHLGVAAVGPTAQPVGRAVGDWRYEFAHGALTEAYDVRDAGVEQSFVLHAPMSGSGDLDLRVAVSGGLAAPIRAPQHGELLFHDAEGRARVRYGAALAYDAVGRRVAVCTSFDGRSIGLHVPAAWLATATYPVVVDPLLGAVVHSLSNTKPVRSLDLGHETTSPSKNVLLAFAYAFSPTDIDLRVFMLDAAMTNPTLVFADISTQVTDWPRVAYVHGASRWIVVFEHGAVGATPSIRRYTHPRGDATLNAGGATVLVSNAGRHPDVGGVHAPASLPRAYVVWSTDAQGSGQYTDVRGYVVDVLTGTLWVADPSGLPSGTAYDRDYPTVSQGGITATEGWVAAWSELRYGDGRTRIMAAKVAIDGGAYSARALQRSGAETSGFLKHVDLDGCDGRYLLSYVRADLLAGDDGNQLHVVRFDWPTGAQLATYRSGQIHAIATAGRTLSAPRVAYDRVSRSHWAVAHVDAGAANAVVHVRRVGYQGGTLESQTLSPGVGETRMETPSVTFDADARVFGLAAAGTNPGGIIALDRLAYPAGALRATYGTGCGGAITANQPDAGYEFFTVSLVSPAATAAALLIGASPAAVPLAGIGMPGCHLLVSVDPVVSLPVAVNQGQAALVLPLNDSPALIGDVYCQWLQARPGNALGLVTSQGLAVHIR